MNEQETTETTRTTETTTETRQEAGITPAGGAGEDLGKVRDLVLKAHPDVVPDLVRGNSVDELIGSVEPARSAYQRVADQVKGAGETTVTAEAGSTVNATGETTVVVQPPVVPAGGASNVAEPADLSPTTKIAQAIAARRRK